MSRTLALVTFVGLMTGASPPALSAQVEETSRQIVFENKDFAVIPLTRIRNQKLEGRYYSGLIVSRGNSENASPSQDIWEFSSPQFGSDRYYWADSARGDHLTAWSRNDHAFLVVSKSGKRLNRKLFASDLPGAFKESVGLDVQSIAGLVVDTEYGQHPGDEKQRRAYAGLEDLSFKSNWLSTNEAAPLVDVTARTIGRLGVVQQCTVWYVPLAWADDKSHWKRFDRFSSPTSQSIPVGQYQMWANHKGQDGTKSKIDVGDDLKPTKSIDLDVP